MENQKCPGIVTQRSTVSLNAGLREKAGLEGGSNFHRQLPEDEDWVSWYYDCSLFTHKEQEKHRRKRRTGNHNITRKTVCMYLVSSPVTNWGKEVVLFLACFLNERRFIQPCYLDYIRFPIYPIHFKPLDNFKIFYSWIKVTMK